MIFIVTTCRDDPNAASTIRAMLVNLASNHFDLKQLVPHTP